ncbi:MAG: branched-chain amino acid ABC transporter permease [Lawsonibacter sp.]|nr:branched-chain amino acid ABC transporter permease [Lawsonibacter sp.]
MFVFLQQIINGLAQGGIYSLIAIGWTTVFGIVGVINWTHGEVYMLGAYVGYFVTTFLHLPLIPALLVSMLAGMVIAVLVDEVGYRPLRKRGVLAATGFITALGLSTILRYSASAAFTVNPRAYPELIEQELLTLFKVGDSAITISSLHLIILIGTFVIMVALELFMKRTLTGKAMLAASQDMQTLGLMGVNAELLIKITFAISGALGAAAGFFIGLLYAIDPIMGALAGLKGWSCAILGGIGSIAGSLVGGILLGIAESLTAGFISTGYKDAIGFAIMIFILLIKPSGLMGYKFEEKV